MEEHPAINFMQEFMRFETATLGILDICVSCCRFRLTLLLQYALSLYRHYIDSSFVLRTLKSIYTKLKINQFVPSENTACFHYTYKSVSVV